MNKPHFKARPIIRIDPDNCEEWRYESIAEAVRETGISYYGIMKCITKKQEKAGGYRWRFETEWG